MRIPGRALPKLRTAAVASFTALAATLFGVMWVNMGGEIPFITGGYRVAATFDTVQNLAYDADIREAGVPIGKVRDIRRVEGGVDVIMEIRGAAHPLHEGAVVRLRPKTLVEETYIELIDGDGPEIPDGGHLAPDAEQTSVQLDDVLNALDEGTRADAQVLVRSLGDITGGTEAELAQLLGGLGQLGREGHTVLDVLAAQGDDLQGLVAETTQLLDVLDTGEGQIGRLVTAAEALSSATAGAGADLESSISLLPGVVASAQDATGPLGELTSSLAPIARDLRTASVDLSAALVDLRPVTADLRALVPDLDGALVAAPATIDAVPPVVGLLQDLVPDVEVALADLNPMLGYLEPYGPDVAAFFTNFGQALGMSDANGHYLRAFIILDEQSVKFWPFSTNQIGLLDHSNAYPAPGQSAQPGPFRGEYERVEEAP
jgi:phospholipid/cholesterol/gamma-HCH transport system substrate-binding protein